MNVIHLPAGSVLVRDVHMLEDNVLQVELHGLTLYRICALEEAVIHLSVGQYSGVYLPVL
ncbi:hypothetical protein [Rufibacter sp. XAAS-G3-1]|uniref:hypothetical protein n=1 Tax=Rufibacter sp. XAAS-G3-1 TaxID=2729134 RepID=UPI0015E72B2C|nr:hypothetical protein [Rufibacter sp. XAAS-G3-1]